MKSTAQLILKSGEIFNGLAPVPQDNIAFGEVVFNTGMTGYTETLTDPSYAGQILVFTYPLIGNYGVADASTWESEKIHVKGVVMSELSSFYTSHEAQTSLIDWLTSERIPILTNVDTRALTKCLRTKGVIPGAIVSHQAAPNTFEDFENKNWVSEVSIREPQLYGEGEKLVIVVDCGMKENILSCLKRYPIRIKRVPFDYDYTNEPFDGVFISNGPGDPMQCQQTISILRKALKQKKPTFGICLGTQLMALAVGAKTYKLIFGHRSQNQPCLHLSTNRSYLTSQNHGYAIDEATLPDDWADMVNAHVLPGPGVIKGLASVAKENQGLILLAEMSSQGHLMNAAYIQETLKMAEAFPEFVMGFITQHALSDDPKWINFTPGIKRSGDHDALGQQYITPKEAILKQGTDVIIVGRGILAADDPVAEAKRYREEGWKWYGERAG